MLDPQRLKYKINLDLFKKKLLHSINELDIDVKKNVRSKYQRNISHTNFHKRCSCKSFVHQIL